MILAVCFVLVGCSGRYESDLPEDTANNPSPSPYITQAPGSLPDPSDLPLPEDSEVGTSVTVDCKQLENCIFRVMKQEDGTLVIIGITAKEEGLFAPPITVTVYRSTKAADTGTVLSQIEDGIECIVEDQRYLHAEVWHYFAIAVSSLQTRKTEKREKLSDAYCYGYIKPGEALTEGENFFYDCEASRDGIESVFKRIIEHYGVLGSVIFNIPKSYVQSVGYRSLPTDCTDFYINRRKGVDIIYQQRI